MAKAPALRERDTAPPATGLIALLEAVSILLTAAIAEDVPASSSREKTADDYNRDTTAEGRRHDELPKKLNSSAGSAPEARWAQPRRQSTPAPVAEVDEAFHHRVP